MCPSTGRAVPGAMKTHPHTRYWMIPLARQSAAPVRPSESDTSTRMIRTGRVSITAGPRRRQNSLSPSASGSSGSVGFSRCHARSKISRRRRHPVERSGICAFFQCRRVDKRPRREEEKRSFFLPRRRSRRTYGHAIVDDEPLLVGIPERGSARAHRTQLNVTDAQGAQRLSMQAAHAVPSRFRRAARDVIPSLKVDHECNKSLERHLKSPDPPAPRPNASASTARHASLSTDDPLSQLRTVPRADLSASYRTFSYGRTGRGRPSRHATSR